MNTKVISQGRSRQASVTPYPNPSQRNGHIKNENILPKINTKVTTGESTNAFEMINVSHQHTRLEALDELEHLVPNSEHHQVPIINMSSLLYDHDDETDDMSIFRQES
jgi:hypothetical protein